MCDNLGEFDEFSESDNVVIVGGNIPLKVKGKGSVRLNCCLPNRSYQIVILQNVLYVPTLGHKLVSWNVLCGQHELKGVRNLSDNADYLYVYNKDNIVFMAKYIDNFPYLCLSTYDAFPVEESDPREVDQRNDAENELDDEHENAGSGTPAAHEHETSAREVTSAMTQKAMYWHVVLGHTSIIKPKLYTDGQY